MLFILGFIAGGIVSYGIVRFWIWYYLDSSDRPPKDKKSSTFGDWKYPPKERD